LYVIHVVRATIQYTEKALKMERFKSMFEAEIMDPARNKQGLAPTSAVKGHVQDALGRLLQIMESTLSAEQTSLLCIDFGEKLMDMCEWRYAIQCMHRATSSIANTVGEEQLRKTMVLIMSRVSVAVCEQHMLRCEHAALSSRCMALRVECLNTFELSLLSLIALPREHHARISWLVLHCVRCILESSEELVTARCWKCVSPHLTCAVLAMESLANLSTTKHIALRMKVYSLLHTCLLAGEEFDPAQRLLQHASKQIQQLRNTEEMELPLPEDVSHALADAEKDIGVLGAVAKCLQLNDVSSVLRDPKCGVQASMEIILEVLRVMRLTVNSWSLNPTEEHAELLQSLADSFIAVPRCTEAVPRGVRVLQRLECLPLLLRCRRAAAFASELATAKEDLSRAQEKEVDIAHVLVMMFECIKGVQGIPLVSGSSFLHGAYLAELTAILTQFATELSNILSQKHETVLLRSSCVRSCLTWIVIECLHPVMLAYEQSVPEARRSLQGWRAEICTVLLTVYKGIALCVTDDYFLLVGFGLRLLHMLLEEEGFNSVCVGTLSQELLDHCNAWRAVRTDLRLHDPVEPQDALSIMHAAFTTSTERSDWADAQLRSGRAASSGQGVFGAYSEADRLDKAFAEMHLDVAVLYVRIMLNRQHALEGDGSPEVRYSCAYRLALRLWCCRSRQRQPDIQKGAQVGMEGKLRACFSSVQPTRIHRALDRIPRLRAQFARNKYMLAVLAMEQARGSTSRVACDEHLQTAMTSISEAEDEESRHKHAFQASLQEGDDAALYPIVYSRADRVLYVSPHPRILSKLSKKDKVSSAQVEARGSLILLASSGVREALWEVRGFWG
jgi:hypothetical protein